VYKGIKVRNYFIDKVLSLNVGATLNGDRDNRLPNNANITFNGVNGESLLYKLDLNGVCASLGAACSAGSIEPSYVLREIGLSGIKAKSSIRFTFGKENTFEEIDQVIKILFSILK
jgi:cysteine desulfurase